MATMLFWMVFQWELNGVYCNYIFRALLTRYYMKCVPLSTVFHFLLEVLIFQYSCLSYILALEYAIFFTRIIGSDIIAQHFHLLCVMRNLCAIFVTFKHTILCWCAASHYIQNGPTTNTFSLLTYACVFIYPLYGDI